MDIDDTDLFTAIANHELLVCDGEGCGLVYRDDHDALSESCDACGRFKQRMEWLELADLKKEKTLQSARELVAKRTTPVPT